MMAAEGAHDDLPARLEARADALAARALADLGTDPFWAERFGDSAPAAPAVDVAPVVAALRAGGLAPLAAHARRLREAFVEQGLCTGHVVDGFRRLARAIGAELPDGAPALALLAAAEETVVPEGPAGDLVRVAPALVARALEVEQAGAGERIIGALHLDSARLLSYLADALADGRPDRLTAHLAWARGALERNGIKGDLLELELDAIDMALAEPREPWAAAARRCLAEARGRAPAPAGRA
jgi:hypothetical protein